MKAISTLLALDRRLEVFFEDLHPDFRHFGPESLRSLKTDPYKLFTMLCVYHLSVIVLHSSIVPIFSSNPPDSGISKKLVTLSAKEAVQHSNLVMDMARIFVGFPDKSRLPGIAGYALFVSASIQLKYLGAQGKLQSQGPGCCDAAVLILDYLKEYCIPLHNLVCCPHYDPPLHR
jgi:hypothetical protein